MRASNFFAVVGILISTPAFARAQARACTTPTTPCERWVSLGGGSGKSMVYATHALDAPNTAITRALIMVHGAGRNADHYFETATAAAFLAGALENTIIIAPRFIACTDKPRAERSHVAERRRYLAFRRHVADAIQRCHRSTSSTRC